VLAEARRQADADVATAKDALESAEADMATQHAALRQEVKARGGPDPARLAEANEHLRQAEQDATLARQRLQDAQAGVLDGRRAKTALRQFTPVFEALSPDDQARLLQNLLTSVSFDAREGRLTLAFRPSGIAALAAQEEPIGPASMEAKP